MSTDPRIRRSREQLRQALASLLQEVSYESLSIRDITARAQVGYATYFRHYSDKDALLMDLLTDSIERLQALLPPGVDATPAEEGAVIFEHMAQSHHIYSILLHGEGTQRILDEIRAVAVGEVIRHFQARPDSQVPLEVAATHLVDSLIALTRWWLLSGMPYSPQRMGQFYAVLVAEPVRSFLEPRPVAVAAQPPAGR